MNLTIGQTVQNRYRIDSLLGQGGMGAIYKAWDSRLDMFVALKEMVPQPGIDTDMLEQLRQQFRREAQVMARFNHPHLVRVTDFFSWLGSECLVMDLVEGENLEDHIKRLGPLPDDQVVTWALQLLDALAFCHAQGIIHRDVKPKNIIIRPDGQAVLVDFGLVKLWDPQDPRTQTAMRGVGTREYAPPEQYDVERGHTDSLSDLYSLGATMYHALSGLSPPTPTMRVSDPERFTPQMDKMSKASKKTKFIVIKAMELARSKRWQSADEMAAALQADSLAPAPPVSDNTTRMDARADKTSRMSGSISDALSQSVSGPRRVEPAQKRSDRIPRWVLPLGGLAALLILIGVVFGMQGGGGSPPEPTETKAPLTPSRTTAPTAATTAEPTSVATTPIVPTLTQSVPAMTDVTTTTEAVCDYGVERVRVRDEFDGRWPVDSDIRFDLVLRNVGDCAWPESTRLDLVSENWLDWPASWPVGGLDVGRQIDVSITLTAPDRPQTLTITWQLRSPEGALAGSVITHTLEVIQPLTPTSTPRPALSTPTSTPVPPTPVPPTPVPPTPVPPTPVPPTSVPPTPVPPTEPPPPPPPPSP